MRCFRWIAVGLVVFLGSMIPGCGGGGDGGSISVTVKGLKINPSQASLYYGDELILTASGGVLPYSWSSTNLTVGAIDASRTSANGVTAVFVANTKRPEIDGDNVTAQVQVMDAEGRVAQSSITLVEFLILVSPSEASVALDVPGTPSIRFFVKGGESPYFWFADKPYLGNLVPNGDGSILTVLPQLAGTLTLTVTDNRNREGAAVLHIVDRVPSIMPAMVTASTDSTVEFRVSGGTPPYTVYVSDPNIAGILEYDGVSDLLSVSVFNVGQADVILEDSAGEKTLAHLVVTDLQDEIGVSPSGAVLEPGGFASFTVKYGLSPFFWTNENTELGDLIVSGSENATAIFYAGGQGGIATLVVEDSRQVQAVVRVTIAQSLKILPGKVTAPQGTTGLMFAVQGGIPPYSAFLKDYSFGSVTQPLFNTGSGQHEFTVNVGAGLEPKLWVQVVEIYDVGGLKAAVDVEITPSGG